MKIGAVSYFYPPATVPRAIQVERLLAHLDGETVVVCAGQGASQSLAERRLGNVTALRVPYRVARFDRGRLHLGLRMGLPIRRLPDNEVGWVSAAYRALTQWLERTGFTPDVVVTFGHPMSDHLVGLQCKMELGLRWAAHFSDPWADNPYARWTTRELAKIRVLEERVIRNSDLCVFTSPETVDLVMAKYPADLGAKVQYVPHCYDPVIFDQRLLPPRDRYVMRCLGSFYDRRSPEPFLMALERLAVTRRWLLRGVEVEFVGNPGPYRRRIAKAAVPDGVVRTVPEVSYAESVRLMMTAHCLVSINAPAEVCPFFPSKLVDYFGAGRYVFAIVPPGCSARLVAEIGGRVAAPFDVGAVERELAALLETRPASSPRSLPRFSVANVARLWREMLSGAAGTRTASGCQ